MSNQKRPTREIAYNMIQYDIECITCVGKLTIASSVYRTDRVRVGVRAIVYTIACLLYTSDAADE